MATTHKILRIIYDQLLAQCNRARWVAELRKAKLLLAAEAATGAPAAT